MLCGEVILYHVEFLSDARLRIAGTLGRWLDGDSIAKHGRVHLCLPISSGFFQVIAMHKAYLVLQQPRRR